MYLRMYVRTTFLLHILPLTNLDLSSVGRKLRMQPGVKFTPIAMVVDIYSSIIARKMREEEMEI